MDIYKTLFLIGISVIPSGMLAMEKAVTNEDLINEHFSVAYSNTNVRDAKIIAFAEDHSFDPCSISFLINRIYETPSTLLVEGAPHNVIMPRGETKFCKNLTVPVTIRGWDVLDIFNIFQRVQEDLSNYFKMHREGKLAEYIDLSPSRFEKITQRNRRMIQSIEEEISKGTKKIFVVFGSDHYFAPEGQELRDFLKRYPSYVLNMKEKRPQFSNEIQNTIASFGKKIELDFLRSTFFLEPDAKGRPYILTVSLVDADQFEKIGIVARAINALGISFNRASINSINSIRLFINLLNTLSIKRLDIFNSEISSCDIVKKIVDSAPATLRLIWIQNSKIHSSNVEELVKYAKDRNIELVIK